jgi:hypothetical protein
MQGCVPRLRPWSTSRNAALLVMSSSIPTRAGSSSGSHSRMTRAWARTYGSRRSHGSGISTARGS